MVGMFAFSDELEDRFDRQRMIMKRKVTNVPDVASAATREDNLSSAGSKDRRRESGVGILEFSPDKAGRDITPLKMNLTLNPKCITGPFGAIAETFSCAKMAELHHRQQHLLGEHEETSPLMKKKRGYQQISETEDSEGPSIMKRKYHHYTLESDSSQPGPSSGRPSSKVFSSAAETETTSLTNVSLSSSIRPHENEDIVTTRQPRTDHIAVQDIHITDPIIERRFDDFTNRMGSFETKMASSMTEIYELVRQQQSMLARCQQGTNEDTSQDTLPTKAPTKAPPKMKFTPLITRSGGDSGRLWKRMVERRPQPEILELSDSASSESLPDEA
uniref:Uncharacterized protein LOC100377482 n=1 Tax=Saccoglossus kowalevskii TaxID=10224 RepID=A0ABM0GTL3_SACKO|nr:PREDICTED: uncharacterized protein LOC100377482 [Saccoglossus kowalevskii]